MKCNDFRENLIELATDGPADPQLTAHVSQCNACTEELSSMRKTMALMDEWEAPEPSPYFLTRLRAHVKEEQQKAPASMFGWLRRPVLAAALATVLAAGGVVYRLTVTVAPPEPSPGTALADIESLDKNHDLILDTDLVNELSGAPSDDVAEP
jgi:anti-sigma factor RsiW